MNWKYEEQICGGGERGLLRDPDKEMKFEKGGSENRPEWNRAGGDWESLWRREKILILVINPVVCDSAVLDSNGLAGPARKIMVNFYFFSKLEKTLEFFFSLIIKVK